MAKTRNIFVCQACGFQNAKWMGQCPGCSAWNTFVEEIAAKTSAPKAKSDAHAAQSITEVSVDTQPRLLTHNPELDRVFGGGLVPGSVILLGGDPGIGKSTIILQTLEALSQNGAATLYVSGEESVEQIKLRAQRLKVQSPSLMVLTETCIERVFEQVKVNAKPKVLVLDSVQTLYSEMLEAAAGSVSQVRMITSYVVEFAKKSGCVTFLVGHVTKDGNIAGPKVLEHMVDTVLYFESSEGHSYRILRAIKNRFGSTNEIGVFDMSQGGLLPVTNPSELFLSERTQDSPGSVVTVSLEGSRPLLIEVQSLTQTCHGGPPRRTCLGTDPNRISLLAAVMQRELKIPLYDQDLYVNIAGGFRINEPSCDLGFIASITSSKNQVAAAAGTVFFGEVGLTGEVRAVSQPEVRLQEALKLGFRHCIFPRKNFERLDPSWKSKKIKLTGIGHIREMMPAFS